MSKGGKWGEHEAKEASGVATVDMHNQDESGLMNGKDCNVRSFPVNAWKFV